MLVKRHRVIQSRRDPLLAGLRPMKLCVTFKTPRGIQSQCLTKILFTLSAVNLFDGCLLAKSYPTFYHTFYRGLNWTARDKKINYYHLNRYVAWDTGQIKIIKNN